MEPMPSIVDSRIQALGTLTNQYRLLQCMEPLGSQEIYSLFVTTQSMDCTEEEFVFDIARDKDEAMRLFLAVYGGNVSVCTLRDVLSDLIASP